MVVIKQQGYAGVAQYLLTAAFECDRAHTHTWLL